MEKKCLLSTDIRCPKDMTKLKWLANQTPHVIELSKDLFRQIRPFCTEKTCRKMTAGKYEYQWKHHARSKKPRSYPAQYYLKMMFQWINQQKHIFEMESARYERLVRHMREEDLEEDHHVLHLMFRERSFCLLIADYLHDPFYYLTGIWAKAFSVFAHVFCSHFGNEELSPEVKVYVEMAFERFMRFVKGYRILSSRRLAPLDKRIAKLDLKAIQPASPVSPRESKNSLSEKSKVAPNYRASFVTSPKTDESRLGTAETSIILLSPSESYEKGIGSAGSERTLKPSQRELDDPKQPRPSGKVEKENNKAIESKEQGEGEAEAEGVGSGGDPEALSGVEPPGGEDEEDHGVGYGRRMTKSRGLDSSSHIVDIEPGGDRGIKDSTAE